MEWKWHPESYRGIFLPTQAHARVREAAAESKQAGNQRPAKRSGEICELLVASQSGCGQPVLVAPVPGKFPDWRRVQPALSRNSPLQKSVNRQFSVDLFLVAVGVNAQSPKRPIH